MNRVRSRKGFTLMELVIVVLIIGILAAFGVPQYFKTIETSKAEDAASMVAMIGTTNRMYALDHSNVYTGGTLTNTCNSGSCTGGSSVCQLVACKYLAAQDWDAKPWRFATDSPTGNTVCTAAPYTLTGTFVACGIRRPAAMAPYNGWGYGVDTSGTMTKKASTEPTPVSQ